MRCGIWRTAADDDEPGWKVYRHDRGEQPATTTWSNVLKGKQLTNPHTSRTRRSASPAIRMTLEGAGLYRDSNWSRYAVLIRLRRSCSTRPDRKREDGHAASPRAVSDASSRRRLILVGKIDRVDQTSGAALRLSGQSVFQ